MKKTIRILNVITGGMSSEGITSMWYSYCKEIKKQGLDKKVEMVFPYIDGLGLKSSEDRFNGIGIRTPHLPNRKKHPIKYFFSLMELIKKGRYDIIHANGCSSLLAIEMLAGKCCRVKVRISHSRNTTCDYKMLHPLFKIPFKMLCNVRFACGTEAGKWLYPNQDFTVIHNGKDFSAFKYSEKTRKKMREELGLNDKFVIGHVGKFITTKNQRFLLDVIEEERKIIPESVLYLMGEGEQEEEIRALVKQKGLSDCVIIAGLVNDMPDRLQAMDIMALPSFFEGIPNVMIEWQAMGLPSIVSDVVDRESAPSELVTFFSLNKGAKEWAEEIKRIRDNSRLRDRREDSLRASEALREAGYDITSGVKFLISKYEELMNK